MSELRHYVERARDCSRERFLELHPEPVFLVEPHPTVADTTLLRTLHVTAGDEYQGFRVEPVVKRSTANAFATMVTIGRARNNDVVISAPGVSKFHAYVRIKDDPPLLSDGGSSFGTFLNGKRLAKGDREPVSSKSRISLGTVVHMQYLTAADLFVHLQVLLQQEQENPTPA